MENVGWKNKAFAFLVRSRQELWGKHNEDMLVWLFRQGISNRFAQDMLLGWNKYSKSRPTGPWGISQDDSDPLVHDGKVTLPKGLVIPYLVNKDLRKLIFYDHQTDKPKRCFPLPGGSDEPMILGRMSGRVAVVFNIIHALRIHQDMKDSLTVIVPHRQALPDEQVLNLIKDAAHCRIFPDPLLEESNPLPEHIHGILCESYTDSEDLVRLV